MKYGDPSWGAISYCGVCVCVRVGGGGGFWSTVYYWRVSGLSKSTLQQRLWPTIVVLGDSEQTY